MNPTRQHSPCGALPFVEGSNPIAGSSVNPKPKSLPQVQGHSSSSEEKAGSLQAQLQQKILEIEDLRTALDEHAIVAVTDQRGIIRYANEQFCRISGYSRGELLGRNHNLLSSGQHSAQFFQDLWCTISSGKVWKGEICNRAKNGSLYWLDTTIVPFLNNSGQPYQYIAIRTDISQRKQVQTQLQASQERYRALFEDALEGILCWDLQGQIREANPALAQMLGYAQPTDLIGKAVAQLFQDPAQALHTLTQLHHQPQLHLWNIGWRGVNKPLLVNLMARAIRDEQGNLLYFRGMVLDSATQTQAWQQEMQQLQTDQQQKEEFLSRVSHELRTPLTNLKMGLQMLNRPLPTEKQQQYLNILRSECERGIVLLNDLLDLQRFESGMAKLQAEPIQLNIWIEEITQPFLSRCQERQQHLEVRVDPSCQTFCTDSSSLYRVLEELLNNACKYTPPGGWIQLEVSCIAHEKETFAHASANTTPSAATELQIQLRNSGEAISDEELTHIFDRFYRIPKRDLWGQGGSGLGLTLVKSIVEQLGGSIQVNSNDACTCFQLNLPSLII
ncbi:MAG: PAS domain-containing sensor histidine kinase [Cyanobacteriota bacterium]